MILVQKLIENATAHGGRTAIVSARSTTDYAGFLRLVRCAAEKLRMEGIGRGDRLVLCAPNSVEVAACYFGCHWLGAAVVAVSPDTSDDGLADIVNATKPRLLLSHRSSAAAPSYRVEAAANDSNLPIASEPLCREDDVADILFTTGTTGERKGVVLTQSAIAQAAANIRAYIGNGPESLEMVPLPLSHSFGLGRLRCMAMVGNSLVLERGMVNAGALLKRMEALQVTGFASVPTGFDLIMRLTGDQFQILGRRLQYVEIGSMPMMPETRAWLMRMLPQARICHHYGMTEASRAAFTDYHGDSHKPSSIGKPAPNVTITVRDENGNEAPSGQAGELYIRGGMLLREYWKRPDLTSRALTQSGFRSGDSGWRDQDGYLYLLGRKDDLINVGGRKVSPDEVEEALKAFPGVRDAACVGIPDPDGITGQAVKACLIMAVPLETGRLSMFLRDRLEEHKIPRVFELVDEIPRTESGKAQRNKLRS